MATYGSDLIFVMAVAVFPYTASAINIQGTTFPPTFADSSKPSQDGYLAPRLAAADGNDPSVPTSGPATVTKKVGGVILHVPGAYVDGDDGFQGKFGYLKIKAELPCLTSLTGDDPRIYGKGWGSVLIAQLSTLDPKGLTGEALLKIHLDDNVYLKDADRPHGNVLGENNELAGTGFKFYEDNLLERDLFTYKQDSDIFLLECMRYKRLPYPSCSSRSIINGHLLLEYTYARSFIDQGIGQSLLIDKRIHKLFDLFLQSKSDNDVAARGNCG